MKYVGTLGIGLLALVAGAPIKGRVGLPAVTRNIGNIGFNTEQTELTHHAIKPHEKVNCMWWPYWPNCDPLDTNYDPPGGLIGGAGRVIYGFIHDQNPTRTIYKRQDYPISSPKPGCLFGPNDPNCDMENTKGDPSGPALGPGIWLTHMGELFKRGTEPGEGLPLHLNDNKPGLNLTTRPGLPKEDLPLPLDDKKPGSHPADRPGLPIDITASSGAHRTEPPVNSKYYPLDCPWNPQDPHCDFLHPDYAFPYVIWGLEKKDENENMAHSIESANDIE